MKIFLVSLVAICQAQAAVQDEEPPPDDRSQNVIAQNVGRLLRAFQSLGTWDEHYGYMMDAVETVYERNGWVTESDQFSLDVIRTVESAPPWAVQERFDTLTQMISDRYLLDEAQERQLRSLMIRASNDVFAKHSNEIMKYAVEAVQTRAMGEPFTPEQVQRWTALAEPVFLDMRGNMTAAAAKMMGQLDPEQREILERDFAAANRRLDAMHAMAQNWKLGRWTPADWGMENDPIQMQAEMRDTELAQADPRQPVANGAPVRPPTQANDPSADPPAPRDATVSQNPTEPKPHTGRPSGTPSGESDPWAAYVVAFVQKYSLAQEQTDRAWIIFTDVKTRREELQRRFEQRVLASAPDYTEQTQRHESVLSRLFDQMKRRLDQLPTRAQRRDAAPGEIPKPVIGGLRKSGITPTSEKP